MKDLVLKIEVRNGFVLETSVPWEACTVVHWLLPFSNLPFMFQLQSAVKTLFFVVYEVLELDV